MRLTLTLALCSVSALAACSPQPSNQTSTTNDTITVSETTIDNSDTGRSQPATDTSTTPLEPPAPGTPGGLDNDTTPISEAPQPPESAQGAATVVETYYALLGEKKYRQAWALWENGGRASGMNADAFAASFAKYSEYHAQIGAPGNVDSGAGQRYVQVPVVIYGRMKDGGKFNAKGKMTLHRTVVDGASAAEKSWHIRAAEFAGDQPSPQPTVDNRSTARYRCMDGTRISVAYDPDNRKATASRGGKVLAVLQQQKSASGIAYAGGGYALTAKGNAMTFTAPKLPPIACTIIN